MDCLHALYLEYEYEMLYLVSIEPSMIEPYHTNTILASSSKAPSPWVTRMPGEIAAVRL